MHAILFTIGNFPIYTYGLCLAIAISACLTFAGLLAHKRGWNGFNIVDIGLWSIIIGILGARLGFVLQNWSFYSANPMQILNFRAGGITIIGGLVFGYSALFFLCRRYKYSACFCADVYAAPALLGMAIGRLGCVMQGCCAGRVCDPSVWGAIVYPASANLGTLPRYPSQVYELLLDLVLMVVCLYSFKKAKFQGQTFWLSFGGYGMIRFITEFFREGHNVGLFTLAQWFCLIFFVVGICGFCGLFGRRPLDLPPQDTEEIAEEVADN